MHSAFRYVDGLKSLVSHYQSLMDNLNDAEFLLLTEQIQELRKVMRMGCKRLNWNALGTYTITVPAFKAPFTLAAKSSLNQI